MAVLSPTTLQCPEHMFMQLPIMRTVYSPRDFTVRIHPIAMVAVCVFVCHYLLSGVSQNETICGHTLCSHGFQNIHFFRISTIKLILLSRSNTFCHFVAGK